MGSIRGPICPPQIEPDCPTRNQKPQTRIILVLIPVALSLLSAGCYHFGPGRIERFSSEAAAPDSTTTLRFERGWVFPRAAIPPAAEGAPPERAEDIAPWPGVVPGTHAVVFLEHRQGDSRTGITRAWACRLVLELTAFDGAHASTLEAGSFRAFFAYHGGNVGPHGEWSQPARGRIEITCWDPQAGRMQGLYDLTFECERLGWWSDQRATEIVRARGSFDVRARATPRLGESP